MSKTKSGFLMKLTQKRNGKLYRKEGDQSVQNGVDGDADFMRMSNDLDIDLLDFQAWRTSGSLMLCLRAPSSRRSKSHLTAGGRCSSTVRMVRKKSTTNFSMVPLVDRRRVRKISGMALGVRSICEGDEYCLLIGLVSSMGGRIRCTDCRWLPFSGSLPFWRIDWLRVEL